MIFKNFADRIGSDSILSDQGCTRTEKFHSLLIFAAYFILRAPGRKYVVVWHKWAGPGSFNVSSWRAGLQNCWPVPSLVAVL